MNKRRRHTAKQRARAQKRIVAETQRRLRNLVPVYKPYEYRGWGNTPSTVSPSTQETIAKGMILHDFALFGRRGYAL